jgi:hypothetical protein
MPLFNTIGSSIADLKKAGTTAYFVITRYDKSNLWFCRFGPENGSFDPAFLLSAYVLELDSKPGKVSIVATYSLSDNWLTAFKGIAHLSKEQQMTLELNQKGAAPDGCFAQVCEIKLESPATTAVTNSPNKVIDDLFAPPGATSDGKIDGHGTHTIPRLYMMAAIVMEKQFGASVVALITNRNGAIVASACKLPNEGGCRHAEVQALFKLKGQLPDGGAVFSTLKPCTMCAGLLYALDPRGRLRTLLSRRRAK